MPRVTIYAGKPETLAAITAAVRMDDDLEVRIGGNRAPGRMEDAREDDVVLVTTDLPSAERLQILGLVWRSNHPPRTLFVECRGEGRRSDSCFVESADRERCLAAIQALAAGESITTRLTISLLADTTGEEADAEASLHVAV